jgi:hypothetical protein
MSRVCNNNAMIIDGFSLAFQIVFVFAFLTIFFFVYVVKVEKDEFEEQMNYVVDNILTENIEKELLGPINQSNTQSEMVAMVSGLIDMVEFQESMGSNAEIKNINDNNSSIMTTAFKNLSIVVGVLILMSLGMLVIGYCLPVHHQTMEALWIVLFVALTEFTFLQVVAKNYKSADPNKVKRVLGSAITKWIKEHKKI